MKNNELIYKVAEYVYAITHDFSCDYEGSGSCFIRPCPFSSWEEAEKAYLLYCQRQESRNYRTLDEQWQDRLYAFCLERGIRRPKKLRPRRRK